MTGRDQCAIGPDAYLTDAELDQFADQIVKYVTPIPMLPSGLH